MFAIDSFLRPLLVTDKNIHVYDTTNTLVYTINPFSVTSVNISNNLISVNLKFNKVVSLDFRSTYEAKAAILKFQQQLDVLRKNVPYAIDQQIQNYVDNAISNVHGGCVVYSYSSTCSSIFDDSINQPQDIFNGYTFSSISLGVPSIYINGAYVLPSSSTFSLAFFSINGGLTASSNIEVGSKLYLNPCQLGFGLDTTDIITVDYLSS